MAAQLMRMPDSVNDREVVPTQSRDVK